MREKRRRERRGRRGGEREDGDEGEEGEREREGGKGRIRNEDMIPMNIQYCTCTFEVATGTSPALEGPLVIFGGLQ